MDNHSDECNDQQQQQQQLLHEQEDEDEEQPVMGISLELEPHVAQELRERDKERTLKHQARQRVSEAIMRNDGNNQGKDNDNEDDAWQDVLVLPPHLQQKLEQDLMVVGKENDENSENGDEQKQLEVTDSTKDEDESDDDEEETLSLTPPPSLPIVLIDAQRLVGYRPTDAHEIKALEQQLQQSMWGMEESNTNSNNDDDNNTNSDTTLDLSVSRNFETRVSELFDTKAARHSDTQAFQVQTNNNKGALLRLEYPPFFCAKHHDDHQSDIDTVRVVKTQHFWKLLLQPHPVPVVDRLLTHLRNCSRCLSWKAQVRREVRQLARDELRTQQRLERQRELHAWRWSGQRTQRLEKLYQVREALESRVAMTRARFEELSEERDRTVAWKLRQQRLHQHGLDVDDENNAAAMDAGGLEGFDFGSTSLFAFADTGTFLGGSAFREDDDDESDGGFNLMSGGEYEQESLDGQDEHDFEDNEFDDEEKDVNHQKLQLELEEKETSYEEGEKHQVGNEDEADAASSPLEDEVASPTTDIKPNHTDVLGKKGQKQRLRGNKEGVERKHRLQEATQEMEHQQKLERAKAQEEAMIHACTSEELRVTEAMLASLEERMTKVDELLETLQEEEWADEEEGMEHANGNGGVEENNDYLDDTKQPEASFTLLDQILAMVLGALLPPYGTKDLAKHVQWLHSEHQSIVQEWKQRFGRLPPPLDLGGSKQNKVASAQQKTSNNDPRPGSTNKQQHQSSQATATTTKTAEELRQDLGIEPMETENWEDDDNDEEVEKGASGTTLVQLRPLKANTVSATKRKTGLRRGGSID